MSKKEQLFKKRIPDELFERFLINFNLPVELSDGISFMKKDIIEHKTVDKIREMKIELEEYYIPCKARSYLSEISEKNIITILRQILKTRNYVLTSKERSIKGEKFVVYNINKVEEVGGVVKKILVKFD